MPEDSWTYKQAGVDIEAGKEAVDAIKDLVIRTNRPEVMTELGGFGGLFRLAKENYRDPVLVSSTDGVGTKIKLAQLVDKHDTIGIDLVAMCVNDILVMGAEPLFFLDYIACHSVIPERIAALVKGISDGCIDAGCALLGGETAEMPAVYDEAEYDLAGFAVGIVDKDEIIDGSAVKPGDVIIGLPSSGIHSNGYSLVNKLFPAPDRETALAFLNPTRIYVKQVLPLVKDFDVHAMSHITGGGLPDNIERLLPAGVNAVIDTSAWTPPAVFDKVRVQGSIEIDEMFKVFNMGIGLALVVPEKVAVDVKKSLAGMGEDHYEIGRIEAGEGLVILR